jgi:hypothetical protein
VIKEAAQS